MAVRRRMGVENAKNRGLLVEATEQLLREEGYASITARQVAAKAGLKPQLVYYYFETMDDLILAVSKRITEARLVRFEQAMTSAQPLRALWELNSDLAGAGISIEIMSLAIHREAIRTEVIRSAKQFRALQVDAVQRLLTANGVDEKEYPATAIVTIMVALARAYVNDSSLDLTSGYPEALLLVERALERVGEAKNAGGGESAPLPLTSKTSRR